MTKNHLKRITAPKTWKVERKTQPFVTKPNPGAHSYDLCVSINTFFKQYTGLTTTTKETTYIITEETVEINGREIDDKAHQVGFLDVVDIPHADKHFLVSVNAKGQLKPIEHDEPIKERFDKITGKQTVTGGQTEYTTLNGETFLLDDDTHSTDSTIRFTKAQKSIKNVYGFEEDVPAFIFRGKHAGSNGTLVAVGDDQILLDAGDEEIQTEKDYTIVTGNKRPSIDL